MRPSTELGITSEIGRRLAFESKDLKLNLGRSKVMVIGCITKGGLYKSYVYPHRVCNLTEKSYSVLLV